MKPTRGELQICENNCIMQSNMALRGSVQVKKWNNIPHKGKDVVWKEVQESLAQFKALYKAQ
jgi:hypothetical protein